MTDSSLKGLFAIRCSLLLILVASCVAIGCRKAESSTQLLGTHTGNDASAAIRVGEALFGDGNEIAQVNVVIGSKDGPVGAAFANALARQSEGHTNMLVVLEPNVAVKPSTVLVTMVTIKEMNQAVNMFGPAQSAVAHAVTESVDEGVIPKGECDSSVIVCTVFLHPSAKDEKSIFSNNRNAAKLAIARAMKGEPHVDEVIGALKTRP